MRLMIYDATETKPVGWAWKIGALLFLFLRRFDKVYGARSWEDAMEWLTQVSEGKTIKELHFWGHGSWGHVYIDGLALGVWALERTDHPVHAGLKVLAARTEKDSLVWFRTCATFGNTAGHDFASRWADFLQCRVAGSSFNIGLWHPGLHSVKQGQAPYWSKTEGVKKNEQGQEVSRSAGFLEGFKTPNTILFLRSHVPSTW